jgi:hypothetical protein
MVLVWMNSSAGHWSASWIPPEESAYDPCQINLEWPIRLGAHPVNFGTWTVRAEYGGESGRATFEVVEKEEEGEGE